MGNLVQSFLTDGVRGIFSPLLIEYQMFSCVSVMTAQKPSFLSPHDRQRPLRAEGGYAYQTRRFFAQPTRGEQLSFALRLCHKAFGHHELVNSRSCVRLARKESSQAQGEDFA